MDSCSYYFYSPQALEIDRRNLEKYDTTDLEEIERMKKYKDKFVEEEVDKKLQNKLQNTLPAIQEQERINARKLIREEYQLAEGTKIYGLCRFISEKVTVNGEELYPNMFIPDKPVNDLISDDVRLNFDDTTERWLVRVKNGLPKLISRFVVTACLIVDASGPGACRAFVIFLKGEAKPLIFWDGTIEAAELRRQTQFHQKGLSYAHKDLYHESFLRALSMCSSVYFLTLPKHGGWNMTPDGLRMFVDSGMMQPQFEGLFLKNDAKDKKEGNKNKLHNCFLDISLLKTEREYKDVKADYHILLPNTLPIKIGTVMSAMSRFLPFFKEEGLEQDRLWVVETSDNVTAKVMTAVMHNRDYHSIEALFSSKRISNIEEKVKEYIDCVMIIRHSTAIGSKYKLENIQEFLDEFFKNTYVDGSVNRMVPVLLIDNAGVLSEDLAMHQLSLIERLSIDNYEQAQQILGELHFHIVKFAERNPDEMKQRLKTAITTAKEMINTLPRRSRSSSAIMFIATTLLLKKDEILTDDDVNAMLKWLCTEARDRTSMSRSVCDSIGTALSNVICSNQKSITYKNGPLPWTPYSYYVAGDDSINVTKDNFEEILSELLVGKNKALQYLKDEDILLTNKGEDQKTWTVKIDGEKRMPKRFYSLSRNLLTPDANRIVDEAIASDLFHKPDEPIDNFFPFIKHPRLDMVAGQVITGYKHGNTFIEVTGTPGSGKTDWIMMQVVQRAKAGDVVVVFDPTNAFCKEELLGHKIPEEIIDNHFIFWDMSTQGWPVNILEFECCEDLEQKVQKLSSLLISGMHLTGSNQKAIVMTKAEEWLKEYEINNSLSIHELPARFDGNAEERKLKMKLAAILSTVKDMKNEVQPPGWSNLLTERGKVLVISAGNATINVGANPFDILFDTLYSFKDKNREGRMTVVLDEVQTLNHGGNSTLVNVLSRGRKLDISVILASQDYLNRSLAAVYKYCGTHILFRPLGEECIRAVAELTKLDINVIRTLPDFCCAIMGAIYSEYSKKNKQLETAIIGETYRPSYVGTYNNDI